MCNEGPNALVSYLWKVSPHENLSSRKFISIRQYKLATKWKTRKKSQHKMIKFKLLRRFSFHRRHNKYKKLVNQTSFSSTGNENTQKNKKLVDFSIENNSLKGSIAIPNHSNVSNKHTMNQEEAGDNIGRMKKTDHAADSEYYKPRRQRSKSQQECAPPLEEWSRGTYTEVDCNRVEESDSSFYSCNVRRRRALSDMELRSEIRELKNMLWRKTLEDCNML